MKTWLTILLLTISVSTFGQTSVYHPFPDSNAIWNIDYSEPCGFFFDQQQKFYSYTISDDTTINSNLYHKIQVPKVLLVANGSCGTNGIQSGYYAGALRQDTLNKKVYFIQVGSNTEELLYDFALHVGDTAKGYTERYCSSMPDIVSSIDSMLIDGTYRKRWNMNGQGWLYWVEGIGSRFGLLGFSDCGILDGALSWLNCFSQNGQTIYPTTTTNCELITNTAYISLTKGAIKVFPNPFHLTTTLELKKDFESAELKIYNVFGEQVRGQIITAQTTTINRDGLTDGIYFFQVISSDGKLETGRLMIE